MSDGQWSFSDGPGGRNDGSRWSIFAPLALMVSQEASCDFYMWYILSPD